MYSCCVRTVFAVFLQVVENPVPLKPSFAHFCSDEGDKDGALSPDECLTAPCHSLGLIFVCGEGNKLFITDLILNLLVFLYATYCSASEQAEVTSTFLTI